MALAKMKSVVIAALVVTVIGLPAGALIHQAVRTEAGTDDERNQAAAGSAASLSAECVEALKSNARAFGTANMSFSVESVNGPPDGRIFERKTFLQLDGGRMFNRAEWTVGLLNDGRPRTTVQEMAFDGTTFYTSIHPPGRNPARVHKVRVDDPVDSRSGAIGFSFPYPDAAGIFVPVTLSEWKAPAPESLVLHSIASGRLFEVSSTDGFSTVKVEIPDPAVLRAKQIDLNERAETLKSMKTDQTNVTAEIEMLRRLQNANPFRLVHFRLDRDKGYAVVSRDEFTPAGNHIQSIECEDFVHYEDHRLWAPRRCTIRWYTLQNMLEDFTVEPRVTTTITLSDLAFGKREDVSFELHGDAPGSPVLDRTAETATNAEPKPDSTATPVTARPPRAPEAAPDPQPAKTSWLILINVVVFVAIGGYVAYRFLRRRG